MGNFIGKAAVVAIFATTLMMVYVTAEVYYLKGDMKVVKSSQTPVEVKANVVVDEAVVSPTPEEASPTPTKRPRAIEVPTTPVVQ